MSFLDLTTPVSGAMPPAAAVTQPRGTVGQFFFEVLHPGIDLEGSGALIGTPTQSGTFTFTAQASDLSGKTVQHTVTITISPAPQAGGTR